jgi:hypothetical protein
VSVEGHYSSRFFEDPPEGEIRWFVNCNFEVFANTETESLERVFDALFCKGQVPRKGGPVVGFDLTHATEEGEGG